MLTSTEQITTFFTYYFYYSAHKTPLNREIVQTRKKSNFLFHAYGFIFLLNEGQVT